jgi:hypothetical protein
VNASADDAPTWIFARDPFTIAVQRLPTLRLRVVSSAGHSREFDFKDMSELTAFHCGFEADLIRTGWAALSAQRLAAGAWPETLTAPSPCLVSRLLARPPTLEEASWLSVHLTVTTI